MAAKSNTMTPILVGAVVVAVIGGGGWFWLQQDSGKAAKADAAAEQMAAALPKGRLQRIRLGVDGSRLLALDEVKRNGTSVEANVTVIATSPTGLEGKTAIMTQRKTIDCSSRKVVDGQVGYFDFNGKLVSAKSLYSGRNGRLMASDEQAEAGLLCDKVKPEDGLVFADVQEAQRLIQSLPDGYEREADARPDDAHAAAWMCGAAARGRWREKSPADCDRAVKLLPASSYVHMDRGFLNLAIGRFGQAKSDLAKAVELDPKNALALLGRGMAAYQAGDQAGGLRDGHAAAAMDPQVALTLQGTYGFQVGSELTGR